MLFRPLFATVLIAFVAASGAVAQQHRHTDDHTPLHGGVVVGAADVDLELVARADSIALYIRGHGKTVDLEGASGVVVLLNGAEKTEAKLEPDGGQALVAKGSFKVGAGTKAVATVTLPGRRPINARFALK